LEKYKPYLKNWKLAGQIDVLEGGQIVKKEIDERLAR
jgi:hypothetical protein